jgi:predicted RNA-binding protein with PIN domain
MRYVVDGYNMLHATGHLAGKVGPHGLEKARHALLDLLAAFAKTGGAGVTVVFDARRAPARVEPEQDFQGVRVLYALDREADDLIEELIHEDTAARTLTVVSDDRRLKEAARRRQCPTQSCLDFYDTTEKVPQTPPETEPPEQPKSLTDEEVRAWMQEFGASDEN